MSQPTHLNAFVAVLDQAEKDLVTAQAAVDDARTQLNARRVEEGLKPLDFDKKSKQKSTEQHAAGEEVPEEAMGFGNSKKRDSK